jgi:predicted alpha-1,2-mannosidase
MEYAAADASLALMAKGLGHTADAALLTERSGWYRNLWDAGTQAFRPRLADGTWLDPYDPVEASHAFHEGGSYQYQWLVPQDPAGLTHLMGGRAATEKRLDDFFAYPKLLTDPVGTARTDWIEATYAYYSKPTYNPNNEPDLLAPYVYAWVQQPAKIATVARAAFTLFTAGPDGMTGNDDLGTMSAWYLFSALGMYPDTPGSGRFLLHAPRFAHAEIDLPQGRLLRIDAPDAKPGERRFVHAVNWAGKPLSRVWLDWEQLQAGGTLGYTLAPQPDVAGWGTQARDLPR